MDGELLLDLGKLIAPATLVAAFLSYVFGKRLERVRFRADFAREYVSTMTAGMNALLADMKSVSEVLDVLEAELAEDVFNPKTANRLAGAIGAFSQSLLTHRVYLLPVLSFGDSEPIRDHMAALQAWAGVIIKGAHPGNEAKVKAAVLRISTAFRKTHLETGHQVAHVIAGLLDGHVKTQPRPLRPARLDAATAVPAADAALVSRPPPPPAP